MRSAVVLLILMFTSLTCRAEISTAGALVEEVLSQTDDPKAWDWRSYKIQIELGAATINEANAFESSGYHLGGSRSLAKNWIARGALRKIATSETASSRAVALTPFSQAAQPSRYELLVGAGWALLDGRSSTALSPRITDVGHALYFLGGIQYNFFTSRDPEPIPGMRALYYDFVFETGLRLQIFLPENLGVGFEWTYSLPLKGRDSDLSHWQRLGGNLSWSFY